MQAEQGTRGPGTAVKIADGIHAIDTGFQGKTGAIAAFLVAGPEGLGLIETGPETVEVNLIAGVEDAGYRVTDIQTVIVTHIHLDHSGGLGALMRDHRQMRAWVHPVGLPHLVEPERLMKSAARLYGDRMDELWGEVIGVPEDRVHPTQDRTAINVGGRMLVPYDTPGHASHHIALLDEQTGSLFAGDVAGVRVQGTSFVEPPLPPPDIDLDGWQHSIELMESLAPERLVLTHFSAFTDVVEHLAMLRDALEEAMSMGRSVLVPGGTTDELTDRLESWVKDGLGDDVGRAWPSLDAANPMYMSSLGIHRVLRKAGELEE